jgi:hypothetical protein
MTSMETDEERSYSGTVVALVLVGIMLAAIAYRYWPSDEREIRRHISNLAEVLSAPSTENEVARLTRAAALREYFAPDVRVHFGAEQLTSRDALIALVNRWVPPPGGVVVEFTDVTISLADDHQSADVRLTAKMESTNVHSGESTIDTRDAALTISDEDCDWVITSVESRDSTERR